MSVTRPGRSIRQRSFCINLTIQLPNLPDRLVQRRRQLGHRGRGEHVAGHALEHRVARVDVGHPVTGREQVDVEFGVAADLLLGLAEAEVAEQEQRLDAAFLAPGELLADPVQRGVGAGAAGGAEIQEVVGDLVQVLLLVEGLDRVGVALEQGDRDLFGVSRPSSMITAVAQIASSSPAMEPEMSISTPRLARPRALSWTKRSS